MDFWKITNEIKSELSRENPDVEKLKKLADGFGKCGKPMLLCARSVLRNR